jgi:hypothetical protein
MAMNRVQFQPGLSMAEFFERYGSEAQCEAALFAARWPQSWRCPSCQCPWYSSFVRAGRRYWQCSAHRHQSSLISGTVFEATKLPLKRWFLAMHLLTQAKNNVSALELTRHLGACYKTAHTMKHKLMEVMRLREDSRQLDGRVEIDDAYLGGQRSGGKTGRGSENKVPFIAAVQTTPQGKPVLACFSQQPLTSEEVAIFAAKSLSPSASVLSDGLRCFRGVTIIGAEHHHRRGQGERRDAPVQGGEHGAEQPQNRPVGDLPCVQIRQVRPSLSRRGPVPLQSPLRPGSHLLPPPARRRPHAPSARAAPARR